MTPRRYRSATRKAAADETRSRIIAAAQALMRSGKPCSMEAVAKRARVSRVTIYHQFASKQHLLDAAFDDVAEKGGLFSLSRVFSMPDPKAAIREFVRVFCGFWHGHAGLIRSVNLGMADPDIAESVGERNERRRQALAVLVGRLIGPDSAREESGVELIDLLFALTSWETYTQLARPGRTPAAVERIMQESVDAVLRTFASPAATSAR
jgi:AcrR family transcriptional regulator